MSSLHIFVNGISILVYATMKEDNQEMLAISKIQSNSSNYFFKKMNQCPKRLILFDIERVKILMVWVLDKI